MNKNLKKKLRKEIRKYRKLRKLQKGVPIPFEGNAKEVRRMGVGDYIIKFDPSVADKLSINLGEVSVTFKG